MKMTPTTQLVKSTLPPLWAGGEFNYWCVKIERWYESNKLPDEDRYNDLLESLMKNEAMM